MLQELDQDYVRTARAKGLRRRSVIFKHTAKNAVDPGRHRHRPAGVVPVRRHRDHRTHLRPSRDSVSWRSPPCTPVTSPSSKGWCWSPRPSSSSSTCSSTSCTRCSTPRCVRSDHGRAQRTTRRPRGRRGHQQPGGLESRRRCDPPHGPAVPASEGADVRARRPRGARDRRRARAAHRQVPARRAGPDPDAQGPGQAITGSARTTSAGTSSAACSTAGGHRSSVRWWP